MLTVTAPAKLNLFLHILGRRADGYHQMESLVAFAALADQLTIEESDALSLAVEGEFATQAGAGEGNLVLRAAQALRAHAGVMRGARLTLMKHIPVGAGLGGGSADAAAALRGLNQFWKLGVGEVALHAIAATLGADVPMCLASTPALAHGIGTELTPLPHGMPPLYALLVYPRAALLTKDVYTAFTLAPPVPAWQPPVGADAAAWLAALEGTANHLQAAALALSQPVAAVLQALNALRPKASLVRMTGSGACCFALYANEAMAEEAAYALKAEHPEWWITATNI